MSRQTNLTQFSLRFAGWKRPPFKTMRRCSVLRRRGKTACLHQSQSLPLERDQTSPCGILYDLIIFAFAATPLASDRSLNNLGAGWRTQIRSFRSACHPHCHHHHHHHDNEICAAYKCNAEATWRRDEKLQPREEQATGGGAPH